MFSRAPDVYFIFIPGEISEGLSFAGAQVSVPLHCSSRSSTRAVWSKNFSQFSSKVFQLNPHLMGGGVHVEDTGSVVSEGQLGTVNSIRSHRDHTHLWKARSEKVKGKTTTHPMGTVGFHLKIVLEWTLTGTLKTNPSTHTV